MKRFAENLRNIFKIPDLRKKVLFTLFIFLLYRIGGHIPIPGINVKTWGSFMQAPSGGGLFALYDLFVGGAFRRATIFAMGIMPYISASIILQLLGAVIPYFQKLQKQGEEGRKKITQFTRYGTIIIAFLQGCGISVYIESLTTPQGPVVYHPGIGFKLMAVIALTAGAVLTMWLGELISDKGIGNGISLIIFIGIIARLPNAALQEIELLRTGGRGVVEELLIIAIFILFTAAAVLLTQGTRRIPVQYAKKVVGRKIYGGQTSYLPLRINAAGVIPIIFAQAIMFLPQTVLSFFPEASLVSSISTIFNPTTALYNAIYGALIVFFSYFYTAIIFNPVDVAENMKKYGSFIPGRRPGKQTSGYIDRVLSRITLPGSVGLALIAILPAILIRRANFSLFFGGTSLLIIVGVALDTLQQIESHLLMRHYEGFLKSGKIRGRR
ncbi:MAG: preprotein translocase subunit SecY [candidate division Zixibacteria bacterium 4484_93]|nr:MAG: preprotein translocase subunit SecY [candidate division Zixibacteria bacterium 4484_93]RKZ34000.1 MAG: preprotein translocase subunit SecY [bacterium]